MYPLKSLSLDSSDKSSFPFTLPVFQNPPKINLSPVTFFVGENGSGKSTLLEGLAAACSLPTIGSHAIDSDPSLDTARDFAKHLKLSFSINKHRGFFLRAEDFFGFVKSIHELKNSLKVQKAEFTDKFSGYGQFLATSSAQGQIRRLEQEYGDLGALSHGEGFLKIFQSRLVPNGLFLLDEPEAALSPTRQMSLISLMKNLLEKDAQFIIATHSPILMAFPGALIYQFDATGIHQTQFDQVEHVTLTRSFLENPDRFLKHL